MVEEFKKIKGFGDYYIVSNKGRVVSFHKDSFRVLRAGVDGVGYYTVSLCLNGVNKTKKVHQLVAEAFLNHTPCGYDLVVDHIDNDKLNNNLENLQVITVSKNLIKDKVNRSDINSNYTGVTWYKKLNKWCVRKCINKKQTHIGYYTEESDAITAHINA